LKPRKHMGNFRFLGDSDEHRGAPGRGLELAGVEGADEVAKVGFVHRIGRLGEGEPAPLALMLLLPLRQFGRDGEGENLDICHQISAVPTALAITITPKRSGACRTNHTSLLLRLTRGGCMRRQTRRHIALGDDPAPGAARRHEQNAHGRIDRKSVGPVGQGGDLTNATISDGSAARMPDPGDCYNLVKATLLRSHRGRNARRGYRSAMSPMSLLAHLPRSRRRRVGLASLVALLATLILLFGFQGEQIVRQPLVIALLAVPILIQVYFNAGIAYWLSPRFGVAWCVAAPAALIGASNFFELAVAAAISLFGLHSGAALATVVGVLVEVPVMLSVVAIVKRTRPWYEAA
jgi:hypothetical protein